jgi:hypothetical protein
MTAFGFEIGKPINLPPCTFSPRRWYNHQKFTCIEPEAEISGKYRIVHFPSNNYPSLLSDDFMVVQFFDGKLEGLRFNTVGFANKDKTLALLIGKYGKPTSLIKEKFQRHHGVEYESFTAAWSTPTLHVEFSPVDDGSLKHGFMRIETPRARQYRINVLKAALGR